MLLFLVRHAVTAQTGDRLTGWVPVSLSEEGHRQVAGLVERMRPVRLAAVYASPVARAVETARPLAASKGVRVRAREGLGEVRYGEWQGRRLRTLARSSLWRSMVARPSDMRFPGGEALRDTQARAVAAIEELRDRHPREAVAVVTHADIIRLVVAHYAGIHLDLFLRLAVAPASVTALWLGDGGPRLIKLNDTGALDRVVPPQRRSR